MKAMRSADCGMRNDACRLRFRIPTSAFRIGAVAVLCGCNPATSRPPFAPYPQAAPTLLDARPPQVIAEAQRWLTAEGVPLAFVHAGDGYLETRWYDPATRRVLPRDGGAAALGQAVKIRCWADPWVRGAVRLTVEVVYRPAYDPSLPARDMEVPAPADHAGRRLAERLVEALEESLGKAP